LRRSNPHRPDCTSVRASLPEKVINTDTSSNWRARKAATCEGRPAETMRRIIRQLPFSSCEHSTLPVQNKPGMWHVWTPPKGTQMRWLEAPNVPSMLLRYMCIQQKDLSCICTCCFQLTMLPIRNTCYKYGMLSAGGLIRAGPE
jgi:hypothetical protein